MRRLATDEGGDEGVSKMLILLLVTVPIVLVLVLFGGKIIDEFQVGLCRLGVVDPPEWYVQAGPPPPPGETRESRDWSDEECGFYRLEEGDAGRFNPEEGE